jgi:threonine/homoserine/homoserine lactone efflux protein
MNALIEGAVLGLSLAFIFGFGPAFFALMQTAVNRGFGQGVLLAFGIFLNDLTVVVLALLGSVTLIKGSENYKLLGIIGGSMLILFGLVTLIRKQVAKHKQEEQPISNKAIIYVGKGFLLNLANPFVWLFWLTVVVSATASYQANTYKLTLFFAAALGIIFTTDILKVFTASRLKYLLTEKFLIVLNIIAGTGLILFGLFLVTRAVFNI